jgi:hypothetical protein
MKQRPSAFVFVASAPLNSINLGFSVACFIALQPRLSKGIPYILQAAHYPPSTASIKVNTRDAENLDNYST